jgi:predicted AlkP superfamily pyrophosphatase or phosphodiesterase
MRNARRAAMAAGAAAALALTLAAAQPAATGPRLLVILVIDQMRFDYLDRFAHQWSAGLKRLRDDGAIFEHGYFPYLNTVTCAGHATIATGAFPSTHGVIMNEWWQRSAGRRMTCTDDSGVVSLAYGGGTPDRMGHSGHRLKVPTLADRLRARSPQSRIVTVSMKPRSAVMLAGHGGHAVTWFGDANTWATSTAFASRPVPEVARYVTDHPLERLRGEIWSRVRSDTDYIGADESPFEQPRPAWTSRFPHPLAPPGTPPVEFYNLWERSPYGDDAIGEMATTLIQSLQLGRRDVVDYLGVGFSALDYIGHDFGPDSHEVQDALIRLDRTIGDLFATLDTHVGRDRYVIGVSSDHGVAPIPEAQKAAGIDAGRVVNAAVRKVAEDAMAAAHGPGPHVAHVEYTNVYLTDAARTRAEADPPSLQPLIAAVSAMDGVLRVFPSRGLDTRRDSRDPVERAAAHSYDPGESGEIVVVLKPNWIGTDTSTTTHGSMNAYDQHVPVLFLGTPFKPGRYQSPATPADIAPTLASLIALPMPGIDGRVLKEAMRSAQVR